MSASRPPDFPADDSPVAEDEFVYRLVPTWSCDVIDGNWEFQSAAFDNATPENEGESPDDMSVVIGDSLAILDRVPEQLPADTEWAGEEWGVAVLDVGLLQNDEDQEVRRTPNEEELAHGDVRGKKNQGRRRRLKAHAEWVVRPAASPG